MFQSQILFCGPVWIGRRYFADAGAAGGSSGGSSGTGSASAGPAAGGAPGGSAPPLVGPDGAFAEGWLAAPGMDPGLKASKTLAGVKSLPEMALMFQNQEKLLGKKGQPLPTDPADKAGWDAYYAAAGWPKKPEEYPVVVRPANMPAELADNPELVAAFRGWCHELRLTPEQFKGLAERIQNWNLADYQNGQAEAVKTRNEAVAALRTEWQMRYDYNVQLANTAAAAFADGPHLERMKAKGWLEDPDFLRFCVKVGAAVSPDRLHADSSGGIDKAGLRAKIEELETSAEYRDAKHARHAAVTQQVLQLREQLLSAR